MGYLDDYVKKQDYYKNLVSIRDHFKTCADKIKKIQDEIEVGGCEGTEFDKIAQTLNSAKSYYSGASNNAIGRINVIEKNAELYQQELDACVGKTLKGETLGRHQQIVYMGGIYDRDDYYIEKYYDSYINNGIIMIRAKTYGYYRLFKKGYGLVESKSTGERCGPLYKLAFNPNSSNVILAKVSDYWG